MASNPISMIKIRLILRLQSKGRSKLQKAAQTGIARNTLKRYIKEISSGLTFDEINEPSDKKLKGLFVIHRLPSGHYLTDRGRINCWLHCRRSQMAGSAEQRSAAKERYV